MKRLEVWIIAGVLLLSTLLILAFSNRFTTYEAPEHITYSIENKWELPHELEEVSGIAWIGDHKMAAIQDEDGIIFIYDLKKNKITEKIKFDGGGDYEDIAVQGTTAYVTRSDAKLYEIKNYRSKTREIASYDIPFLEDGNIETMTLDAKNNRLLLMPKDRDPNSDDYKGIYAFSLATKKAEKQPFLKIDMDMDAFKDFEDKKAYKTVRPSAMAIHPATKDFYILEGVKPKLLIFDAKGTLKKIHLFDKREFLQPEGITFSPQGTLYISNEANGEEPNILEVSLTSED